jgi:hypothetical protein
MTGLGSAGIGVAGQGADHDNGPRVVKDAEAVTTKPKGTLAHDGSTREASA